MEEHNCVPAFVTVSPVEHVVMRFAANQRDIDESGETAVAFDAVLV
jgi:hypothetical protein